MTQPEPDVLASPVRLCEPRSSILWTQVAEDASGGLHAATTALLLAALVDVANHLSNQHRQGAHL